MPDVAKAVTLHRGHAVSASARIAASGRLVGPGLGGSGQAQVWPAPSSTPTTASSPTTPATTPAPASPCGTEPFVAQSRTIPTPWLDRPGRVSPSRSGERPTGW
jgi:hypothetical protein